jgi:hypothetical protein
MGGNQIGGDIFCNTWSSDDERNSNIFFEAALLSWLKAVLSNVESII